MCNTLQHTATRCNTLQHTATHCNSTFDIQKSFVHKTRVFFASPAEGRHLFCACLCCCSVLQCVAVCCTFDAQRRCLPSAFVHRRHLFCACLVCAINGGVCVKCTKSFAHKTRVLFVGAVPLHRVRPTGLRWIKCAVAVCCSVLQCGLR